jgi:hypothetical protein
MHFGTFILNKLKLSQMTKNSTSKFTKSDFVREIRESESIPTYNNSAYDLNTNGGFNKQENFNFNPSLPSFKREI